MSDGKDDNDGSGSGSDDGDLVPDEMLPDDLVPGEDNPLAEPLDEDEDEGGMSLEDRS